MNSRRTERREEEGGGRKEEEEEEEEEEVSISWHYPWSYDKISVYIGYLLSEVSETVRDG